MYSQNKRSPLISIILYVLGTAILAVVIYSTLEYLKKGTIDFSLPTSVPQTPTQPAATLTSLPSPSVTLPPASPTAPPIEETPALVETELPESSPLPPTEEEGGGELLPTPVPGFPFVTANENVVIRTGPGADFDNIGILQQGEHGAIIAYNNDSTWWAIRYPNPPLDIGWVSADYVTLTGDVTIVPTPQPGAPTLTAAANLNIRSGPGIDYDKIGLILIGQSAEVVGIASNGEWWAIKIPLAQGGRGWVTVNFVEVDNIVDVPVIE